VVLYRRQHHHHGHHKNGARDRKQRMS
jgi:hypothetical protein